jgi:hypothetical protein
MAVFHAIIFVFIITINNKIITKKATLFLTIRVFK